MFTQGQIEQLKQLFETNNAKLMVDVRKIVREETKKLKLDVHSLSLRFDTLEKNVKDLRADVSNLQMDLALTEQRLTAKISREVKDLTDLITTGFAGHNNHEGRIVRLEQKAGITSAKH